jgi:hypothetical protein
MKQVQLTQEVKTLPPVAERRRHKSTTVTSYLYSTDNLPFYRERVRECLELAEASRAVPAIKSRLEALARKYRSWIDELEGTSHASPPLAPNNQDIDSPTPELSEHFDEVDQLVS